MIKKAAEIVAGIIVDENTTYTLHEISHSCRVTVETIEEMIAYGVIQPKKIERNEKQFDSQAMRSLKIALRLQKDLAINLPGVALALDMLNELEALRIKVNILERQLLK